MYSLIRPGSARPVMRMVIALACACLVLWSSFPAASAGGEPNCLNVDLDCHEGETCNEKTSQCQGKCFPGDSLVQTFNGKMMHMSELKIGDKVVVRRDDHGSTYSEIYAFGHQDQSVTSNFLRITMESPPHIKSIELSDDHFVPTTSASKTLGVVYKTAKTLSIGDIMWAANANSSLSLYKITEISTVVKQGLYNPYTHSGTIIVNNVLASAHSSWFLDQAFKKISLGNLLPFVYQAVLSPVRLLNNILAKDYYFVLEHHLMGKDNKKMEKEKMISNIVSLFQSTIE